MQIARSGQKELHLGQGERLTDIARETAARYGIKVVKYGSAQAGPANTAAAVPGAARPVREGPEGNVYDLLIKGGTCVIPEMGLIKTNICVKGGKVAAITSETPPARDVVDATGKYVMPGIIDPHTHLGLFTGFESELESETRSAVLGGVTTIGTYFNQESSYLPLIAGLRNQVPALSRTDMIPHLSIRTDEQVAELDKYSAQGLNSYKVYMCGVPGIYPNQEDGFIVKLMKRMKELPPWANPILSVHCENQSICDYATDEWQGKTLRTLDDWNETHPNLAEGEAVQRTSYLSQEIGVRAYVVHSSTKEAIFRY